MSVNLRGQSKPAKILVLGNTASGKSFLAAKIAKQLNLPRFSLDEIYWQKNWTHVSRAEFLAGQREIIARKIWVIDGTFAEFGLRGRFAAADAAIFLDISPRQCLRRAISRRGDGRASLPHGADDRHLGFAKSVEFLVEILLFNLLDRRRIRKLAREFPGKLIIIKNWSEEEKVLENLAKK